ncbi:MAG: tetratricopeptide repeat protein [Ilumatobacter sp.]|uniref:tetratricopeptide repeat protein n=1 Tax=Ilumatobacter sp. TaxID=1967498 RepID=UPI003C75DA92
MNRRTRMIVSVAGLVSVVFAAGAFGISRVSTSDEISTASDAGVIAPSGVASAGGAPAATLDGLITQLQTRLEAVPGDHVAWSTLGIAYVQQARVTADPSLYPRAEGALDESLAVAPDDNFLAYAGLSSLASARHDFIAAKDFAEQGLAINDFNPLLYGALSDAEVQLGNYDAAREAITSMLRLSPDTSSYSRSSYLAELNGNIAFARTQMTEALAGAGTPTDRAFALTILGDLAFNAGRPGDALDRYNQAQAEAPQDTASLSGKARAEAALGQTQTALDHYAELVAVAPEPSFIIAYGELLESEGLTAEAEQQYAVVEVIQRLFEANGVESDAAPVLFFAEHGEPERALREAEKAVLVRPFLAMHDAHAWALYANGRYDEALVAIEKAMELGTPDARFYFHAGMIHLALGDRDAARVELERALEINPFFDVLDVPVAEAALAELGVAG